MLAIDRPVVYVLGAMLVVLVGVLGVKSAQSRTPMSTDIPVGCIDRVKELEAEVSALREQLRVQPTRQNNSGATVAHSTPSAGVGHQNGKALAESCAPPFGFDHGIKYYKPNCLDQSPASTGCNPPFQYDTKGVKSFKPACL